jgi:ubiquitin-conjugating enzyme E2 J1
VGKKICLSISGHHPESWQPSWSIRTALLAIIGFMPSPGQGTIGSLDYTPEERRGLAKRSDQFRCERCGETRLLLKAEKKQEEDDVAADEADAGEAAKTRDEAREIIKSLVFKVS